jgi:hypothetical protein
MINLKEKIQIAINIIFEKVLTKQITESFDSRLSEYLTDKKRHSCETALLFLTESWRQALDNGECVGLLSTDMSKTFDSMLPPLLLAKLKAYNFDEQSLKLMSLYFMHRYSRVKLGSTTSTWKRVKRGCPQGSAFGPMLWNLFQNDLTYVMKSSICMYADDHQLFETHKDIEIIQNRLQESAIMASKWYEANYLHGNFTRYGSMLISKKKDLNMNIDIQGNTVTPYKSIKLLGENIDCQLIFRDHISEVCKKSSQRVGQVIMRLRNMIPTAAKLQLYKAAILPYVTY